MRRAALLLLAAAWAGACGCTSASAHRLGARGEAFEVRVPEGALDTEEGRRGAERSAIEIHDDYRLVFLEFDDQGNLHSRAPVELLTSLLRGEEAREDGAPINLVLFAHGWKNDARLCNRNVCCFRTFLARLAADYRMVARAAGRPLQPATTIGIYLGWRGLSATVPPFRELSFYARKRAAHAIGQGELVEVLTLLDRFQKRVNAATPNRCRLVTLAHSFGGAIVYSAVANVLKSRIAEAKISAMVRGDAESHDPVEGFGDLVVLANPAFEASLYQPFQELLIHPPVLAGNRPPVLIVLASESDSDTRVFFKIGRFFSTLFQRTGPRSSRAMLVTTVGNYDPFVTHRATVYREEGAGAVAKGSASLQPEFSSCRCRLPMTDLGDRQIEEAAALLRPASTGSGPAAPFLACPGRARVGSVELACVAAASPGPLWVVRTSDEVISGHGGIFTRPASDLVRGLVLRKTVMGMASPAAGGQPSPE